MFCIRSHKENHYAPVVTACNRTHISGQRGFDADLRFMRQALTLARRGLGCTSPNPMVGAVLVQRGQIIGRGWHRQAGKPHAEIEALRDALQRGHTARGATLYVTLEPCCTTGRTPACTRAIIAAGIRRVVIGATDPNPKHAGRAFDILRKAGIQVVHDLLAGDCSRMNEPFNHWIAHGTPLVTLKAAMTLDGKIATANGESKWISGPEARAAGMQLRHRVDAILVGVNTVLKDDPRLTRRSAKGARRSPQPVPLRRFVLDTKARTPLSARVVSEDPTGATTVVVGRSAPSARLAALSRRVRVLKAPTNRSGVQLRWLMKRLGTEGITSLLVEGGGETTASFVEAGLAHRVAFFYASRVLGGRRARRAVAGDGATHRKAITRLEDVRWQKCGSDLLLTASIAAR